MTNAEKFEEVFGFTHRDTDVSCAGNCEQCSLSCISATNGTRYCPIQNSRQTKAWWNSEYGESKSAQWWDENYKK